jgi:putative endonuclease
MSEHKGGFVPGFSRQHGVTRLVHVEIFDSIVEARGRERVLKRWRRDWKLALIEQTNPAWRDLTDDLTSL